MGIHGRSASGQHHRTAVRLARAGTAPAFALALILAAAGVPAAPPAGATPEATVAVVGAETITGGEYQQYLRGYVRSKLYHGGSEEQLRKLADEALESLVTGRLLIQEARRRGIAADEAAVEKRIEALRERYSGGESWPQVEPQLPAIAEKLRADTQIEALKSDVMRVAAPSEADLVAFHAANLELFTEPAAWDLDLVLVGVPPSALLPEWEEAKARAVSLVAAIRAGEAFDQVAAEHSTDGSAADGGRLGKVHSGQLPANVQTAINQLSPGEISDPIQVLEGYAIFRFNAPIAARTHPLDEVRERAEALYLRNTASAQWTAFLEDLRARTHVETFDVSAYVETFVTGE
ncbi:MAG: peptidylprolyl isomerase [Paracoccaceae bacterium]